MKKVLLSTLFLLTTVSCGRGFAPGEDINIRIYPESVPFETVKIGDTVEKSITITHIGSEGVLKIYKTYLTDDSSKEFSFNGPYKTALLPEESTTIKLFYTPQDSGSDTGELVIEHNVPPNFRSEVSLSSLGVHPYLTVIPDPIDFGNVTHGVKKELEISVINTGTEKVTIEKITTSKETSEDFLIEGISELLPVVLEPQSKIVVLMSYTPKNGGSDSGVMTITAKTEAEKTLTFNALIKGMEIGPALVISPGIIDFGWVNINELAEREVYLGNDGTTDLVVTNVSVETNPSLETDFGVYTDQLTFPIIIKPDEYFSFKIYWKPDKAYEATELPIALMKVLSNDPYKPEQNISVFGKVNVPMIQVTPPEVVDFGFVATGVTAEREVVLTNIGNVDLLVKSVEFGEPLDDEFSIVPDPNFKPVSSEKGEQAIPSGAFAVVKLKFKNKGGPQGESVHGKLLIKSNAYGKETYELKLLGKRGGDASCKPQFTPPKINFGTVIQGDSLTKEMYLINSGTGYCSFLTCAIYNCPSLALFSTLCHKSQYSKDYKIVSPMPPAIQNGMGPGFNHKFEIQFTAPVGSFITPNVTASLICQVYNSYTGQYIDVPAKASTPFGEGYPVNLTGTIGYVNIVVFPKVLDFGVQALGCTSMPEKVTIINTGNAPLTIKDISFSGCTPEFKTTSILPPEGTKIQSLSSMDFEFVYKPQDVGSDECFLKIESNDFDEPVVYVNLKGKGVKDKNITESFKQLSGDQYDLLIVLDDCACTLMDFGTQIKAAFEDFIQNGALWNTDFSIGVVIMIIDDKQSRGKLNEGDPAIQPRFVSVNTPNYKQKFKEILDAIMDKHSSDAKTKGGLLASFLAVTEPLTTNTGISCSKDSDCTNNPSICPDAANCSLQCVDGVCGGYNHGFYRPEAYLDIVYISKSDDESPGPLNDYIDMLHTIKGYQNKELIRAHAVTWEEGCGGNVGIEKGKRYIETSKEFNGNQAAICDDWGELLNQIGSGGGGPLKKQFFLSGTPIPATITVSVNGTICTSGWHYDAASNSIIFSTTSPCLPKYNDKIDVSYTILCK